MLTLIVSPFYNEHAGANERGVAPMLAANGFGGITFSIMKPFAPGHTKLADNQQRECPLFHVSRHPNPKGKAIKVRSS